MSSQEKPASRPVGLPGDQGEDGPVWRVKDVIRPLSDDATGGSALLGFASDEGVRRNFGRVGAAGGPAAIREILSRLAVHGPISLYEAGDVVCLGEDLEGAQESLAEKVAGLLDRGTRPVVLGGGHEVAYGSFLGLTKHLRDRMGSTKILVVNLDAHFDLRLAPRPNSGTPFRQIAELCSSHGAEFRYICFGISELANTTALFERAKALDVEYWLDEEIRPDQVDGLRSLLERRIAQADLVYLTVDLDVLPEAVAPGVSAPAARGVPLDVVEGLVDTVLASGKLAVADIAEYNPLLDRNGQTARVAARLAYRLAIPRN
ncbi:formimidoylglutamase [Microvirga subterranea]|uniref:Formimidoylglutamase n=1 Tax=Microvirga subterranea TaxID=186651 RepID=A0A370HRV5_9HYPH|nr:formimidoylglutamase [Microvirga subterranea]RDI61266.1 formiminoglutamase [Microvirga subterranea]